MSRKPIVLTIGVFDGVHRGHQALVKRAVALAKSLKSAPVALTFEDHPMHTLQGGFKIPFLLDRSQTFALLAKSGIKNVHVLHFTKAFSKKSPLAFTRWLFTLGKVKAVVVGDNFRFGFRAQGNVELLRKLGLSLGFKVAAVPSVRVKGTPISSSLIRVFLQKGKIKEARLMLGRPYAIEGEVVHGRHVGHKIGFPTANLHQVNQFLPKDGVYACAVKVGKRYVRGGLNLGERPTFKDDSHHRQAEVHLINFKGRLYGKRMEVLLLDYLRPEKKFPNPKALVRQIRKDLLRVQKTSLKGLK